MIEDIKTLKKGNLITIDDSDVRDYAQCDDLEVVGVHCFSQEDADIIFVDFDGYALVCNTFAGDPRYYFYEEAANPSDYLPRETNEFPERLTVRTDEKRHRYRQSAAGPIECLVDEADEDREIDCCEYRCAGATMPMILVKCEDGTNSVYVGFRIREDSVLL